MIRQPKRKLSQQEKLELRQARKAFMEDGMPREMVNRKLMYLKRLMLENDPQPE
jgi:hypothetical protein